jgi:hypothetical protein
MNFSLSALALILATSAAGQPVDQLFPIREGRQFGFINRSGTVVIPPQYDAVNEFHEGLARVYLGSQAGYIDTKGKLVIPAKWSTAGDFEQGRALVSNEGKYSIIDKQGKVVAEIPHRVLGEFHGGLAVIQRARTTGADGKAIPSAYGYIDRSGKIIIEPQFMPAGAFPDDGDGLAVGGLERHWVYFDRKGKIVMRVSMEGKDRADGFHDGLVRMKEGFFWGYKNAAGEWAIAPKFDEAGDFENGRARVELEGKWTLIDKTGQKIQLPPGPRQIRPYSDGLALAAERDRNGYLDAKGELAFPLRKYEAAYDFVNGRARFKLDGKFGYLDKKGNLAIPNQFASATDFKNGLAYVMAEEGWAYIDTEGKVVWKEAKRGGTH